MAKFRSLQAPVTNDAASKRFQDTQAIRARQLTGTTPTASLPMATAQAAQAGAQLTAEVAEKNIQEQNRQAGLAQGQTQLQLGQQRQAAQQSAFQGQQNLQDYSRRIDDELFKLSQSAADEEQQMRLNFNNRVAEQNHLNEMELADWALQNAQNEQDFADKIQSIEQAHARRNAIVDHAFKVKMQDLRQKAAKASAQDSQEFQREMVELKAAFENEQRRREAEANNRAATKSAMGTILGAAGAGAATAFGAPYLAPIIMAGTQTAVTKA